MSIGVVNHDIPGWVFVEAKRFAFEFMDWVHVFHNIEPVTRETESFVDLHIRYTDMKG